MPLIYQIIVESILDPSWSICFDDFRVIQQTDGTTLLEGVIEDQAALHGILMRMRDFGLSIVSVHRKEKS